MVKKRIIKNFVLIILMGVIFVFSGEKVDAATCEYIWDTKFVGSDIDKTLVSGSQVKVSFEIDDSGFGSMVSAEKRYKRTDDIYYQYQELTNDNLDDPIEGLKKFQNATSCPKLALCWLPQDEEYQLYYEEENGTVIGCLDSEKNLIKDPEVISSGFTGGDGTLTGCSDATISAFEQQFQEINNTVYDKYLEEVEYINNYRFGNSSTSSDDQILNGRLRRFWEEISGYIPAIESDAMAYDCDEIVDLGKEKTQEFQTTINGYINNLGLLYDSRLNNYITELENAGEDEKAQEYVEIKDKIAAVVNDILGQVDEEFDDAIGSWGEEIDATCEAILGDLRTLIQQVFDIIKIAAPILLIFFGSMDFAKAVVAGDDKATKKATSDFMKRAIAAVLIFFIPWFIELIFSLPGLENLAEDVLCGVGKVVLK